MTAAGACGSGSESDAGSAGSWTGGSSGVCAWGSGSAGAWDVLPTLSALEAELLGAEEEVSISISSSNEAEDPFEEMLAEIEVLSSGEAVLGSDSLPSIVLPIAPTTKRAPTI